MKRLLQLVLLCAPCLALGCSEIEVTPEDRQALIEQDRAMSQAEFEHIQEAKKAD